MTDRDGDPRHGADGGWGQGMHNTGVVIGGNASVSGPVAAGYQAQAIQSGQGAGEMARLEGLLRQLEAGLRELGGADADDALDDVVRVRQEMESRKPDRPRVGQLMDRIVAAVGPVSGLLEIANGARELITAILH
jgi:hypothetical protein